MKLKGCMLDNAKGKKKKVRKQATRNTKKQGSEKKGRFLTNEKKKMKIE